jgi:hypothetical protein
MRIVGFNYTKISGERIKPIEKEVKINTGTNITLIEQIKPSVLNSKDEFISVEFEFSLNYETELAQIKLNGQLLLNTDSKKAKEILKMWKDKKMPEDFKLLVFNHILRKSNLRCLQLEEELHLPIHIKMPRLSSKENSKE